MPIIVISTTSFAKFDDAPVKLCKEKGFDVVMNPHGRKVTEDEIVDLAKGAEGLLAGTESLSEGVLSKLPGLKVISRCGVGMSNVDLEAAEKFGIKVLNTPYGPTLAVAELSVGLMLGLLRKVVRMDRALRKGEWNKLMGNLLTEKTIGIIGFGRIGRKVVELLAPFRCRVAFSDPAVTDEALGATPMPLDDLLGWADIVSVHVSANTRILGEDRLRRMKEGAWLVNLSRGEVVDEEALIRLLVDGRLAGAALDVFEHEPYKGKLAELDNVILTPHVGSYAREGRIEMEKQAMDNLLKGLGIEL